MYQNIVREDISMAANFYCSPLKCNKPPISEDVGNNSDNSMPVFQHQNGWLIDSPAKPTPVGSVAAQSPGVVKANSSLQLEDLLVSSVSIKDTLNESVYNIPELFRANSSPNGEEKGEEHLAWPIAKKQDIESCCSELSSSGSEGGTKLSIPVGAAVPVKADNTQDSFSMELSDFMERVVGVDCADTSWQLDSMDTDVLNEQMVVALHLEVEAHKNKSEAVSSGACLKATSGAVFAESTVELPKAARDSTLASIPPGIAGNLPSEKMSRVLRLKTWRKAKMVAEANSRSKSVFKRPWR
jgi:hypothetical protein